MCKGLMLQRPACLPGPLRCGALAHVARRRGACPAAPPLPEQASAVTHGSGASSLRAPSSGVSVEPWEIPFGELEIQRPIGEGSFGRVFAVRCGPQGTAPRVPGCSATRRCWLQSAGSHSSARRRCLALQLLTGCTRSRLQGTWHSTPVAVKVLLAGPAAGARQAHASLSLPAPALARLEGEASLLASLRHPNVVRALRGRFGPPAGACLRTCVRACVPGGMRRSERGPGLTLAATPPRALALHSRRSTFTALCASRPASSPSSRRTGPWRCVGALAVQALCGGPGPAGDDERRRDAWPWHRRACCTALSLLSCCPLPRQELLARARADRQVEEQLTWPRRIAMVGCGAAGACALEQAPGWRA